MDVKRTEDGWYICMNRGELVMESLRQFQKKEKIASAWVSAIGATMNTRLGFYHLHKKQYDERTFKEEMELVSLSGNLSWFNDEPIAHCHVVLGGTDFNAYAGHLFEAEIAVVGEFYVRKSSEKLLRSASSEIGLNLWDLCKVC